MPKGYLNLVLHAHLPFVRHLDKDNRLEERWLFEAMTETYIPLLQVFQGLIEDGVDFRVTISLSPPLISMLADTLLQSRYRKYLQTSLRLAESEVLRTRGDDRFYPLATEYQRRFQSISDFFDEYNGNILTAFSQLAETGRVELITSAATHAFLPYLMTDEALRAQIAVGVALFQKHFGRSPVGIWLPECAFTPRVLPFLEEFSIRYFMVDTHAFHTASPQPVFGTASPILTANKVAAFARDEECSKQVWSSETGYPGDFDYREYYRDIGFDLDDSYINPYIHEDGIRVNTGFKYYRITGKTGEKQPYNVDKAREKAAEHAENFLFNRQRQAEYLKDEMGRLPVITAPYDAELFGHWWYEGPVFLDVLLRKIYHDQTDLTTITPSEYLGLYSDFQSCEIPFSTWGRDGYGDVWLNHNNDWVYPALHDAELRLQKLVNQVVSPDSDAHHALNQAARELMLAQSSDFAFIMDVKSTVEYAVSRVKQHLYRFCTLAQMIETDSVDLAFLTTVEAVDNIFPNLSYEIFQSPCPIQALASAEPSLPGRRILMLSWEFPPMSVGGLSRHVYDLSRYLVSLGHEIHVVTTAVGGYPLDEVVEGVHVHRVVVLQPDGGDFTHFAFQLNLMMIDRCVQLVDDEGLEFGLIHAHDWLVSVAAKTLKKRLCLPVVATIHATEHGRNHGIYTDTHKHIHHHEWTLTYEAERIIVCSSYMQEEVMQLFDLPAAKIDVIPNGVDSAILNKNIGNDQKNFLGNDGKNATDNNPKSVVDGNQHAFEYGDGWGQPDGQTVLFVGRLVREKGVHLLLEAAPKILAKFPDTRFVIVGQGPMMDSLTRQAEVLGISNHVVFTGYANDDVRNHLLNVADVAVFPSLYEPFGIVALEAMAAGTPVVVSDTGGLGDIVQHMHNGLKVYPDNAGSIADQVTCLLGDRVLSQQLVKTAWSELARYDWRTIAETTSNCYQKVVKGKELSTSTKP